VLAGIAALALFGLSVTLLVWNCTQGTAGRNRFDDAARRPR